MSAAEGWAAQQLRLPADWYQGMPCHEIGFPISGDATTIHEHETPVHREPPHAGEN
jgi:hypothetical protein